MQLLCLRTLVSEGINVICDLDGEFEAPGNADSDSQRRTEFRVPKQFCVCFFFNLTNKPLVLQGSKQSLTLTELLNHPCISSVLFFLPAEEIAPEPRVH